MQNKLIVCLQVFFFHICSVFIFVERMNLFFFFFSFFCLLCMFSFYLQNVWSVVTYVNMSVLIYSFIQYLFVCILLHFLSCLYICLFSFFLSISQCVNITLFFIYISIYQYISHVIHHNTNHFLLYCSTRAGPPHLGERRPPPVQVDTW